MRGIPFSTPMVKALLNTRPDVDGPASPIDPTGPVKGFTRRIPKDQVAMSKMALLPRYVVGQVYVVREGLRRGKMPDRAFYQAGGLVRPADPILWRWKRDKLPSRYMPDEAGRLFVKIVGVEAADLETITGMDCVYEGILVTHDEMDRQYGEGRWGAKEEETKYICKFARLIDELHGRGTWASGPLCWVYEIRRVSSYV